MKEKEKERGKERCLGKKKKRRSSRRERGPPKVVTQKGKENGKSTAKRGAEKECVYVFIEHVELCVFCVAPSPLTRVGGGLDLAPVRPISSSAV